MKLVSFVATALVFGVVSAGATTFTLTSPTGGALPSGVTAVGGIVIDLQGLGGSRVISQVAASSEYTGTVPTATNPLTFGTQTGFTPAIVAALGGGISSASFRVTLYDGDTGVGDFDYNSNFLLVNGNNFGNFSSVTTQQTNSTGTVAITNDTGFRNDLLDTGFFSSTNTALLSSLFNSLSSGSLIFQLNDLTPGQPVQQFFDFTQGIDSSLIDVTQPPTVVAVTPEPESLALMATGLLGLAPLLRKRLRMTI